MSSKGCVLDLRMHDKKGTNVHDYSRYGNDGAVNGGVEWVEHGMRFDGSTGYLDCGSDPSLDITDAFTIMGWFYHNLAQTGYLVSKNNLASTDHQYAVYITSTGGIETWLNGAKRADAAGALAVGEWTHIAIVWNKIDIRHYSNCKLKGTPGAYSAQLTPTSYTVNIGRRKPDSFYFDGIIDQPRIFNRALTLLKIKRDYEATKHKYM